MSIYTRNIVCYGNVRKRKYEYQWHLLLTSNRINGKPHQNKGEEICIDVITRWSQIHNLIDCVLLCFFQQRQSNLTAEEDVNQPNITITEGQPVNNCSGCKFLWYVFLKLSWNRAFSTSFSGRIMTQPTVSVWFSSQFRALEVNRTNDFVSP